MSWWREKTIFKLPFIIDSLLPLFPCVFKSRIIHLKTVCSIGNVLIIVTLKSTDKRAIDKRFSKKIGAIIGAVQSWRNMVIVVEGFCNKWKSRLFLFRHPKMASLINVWFSQLCSKMTGTIAWLYRESANCVSS